MTTPCMVFLFDKAAAELEFGCYIAYQLFIANTLRPRCCPTETHPSDARSRFETRLRMRFVNRSTELADSLTISQECGSGQKGFGRRLNPNSPFSMLRTAPEVIRLSLPNKLHLLSRHLDPRAVQCFQVVATSQIVRCSVDDSLQDLISRSKICFEINFGVMTSLSNRTQS